MAQFCVECGTRLQDSAKFCIYCGASASDVNSSGPRWQEKKERVLGKKQQNKYSPKNIAIILGVVILGGWVYLNIPESGNPVLRELASVTTPAYYNDNEQMASIRARVESGFIVLPLDVIKERRFVRFMYGDSTYGLPILAYITNEGKIVTAVSVCEPCNSTTFHLSEKTIICNSCGTTWDLNNLEAISGSCGKYPPDALPNTIVGNEIHIEERSASEWRRRI